MKLLENLTAYNRIIIIGNNGSGKSYFARELSKLTGLPAIHLDAEFWLPNWQQPSESFWIKKQKELIAKEKWIIDGNHSNTMELRFKAADAVIFLDINRFVCLMSVFTRRGKQRSDMPRYLEESIDSGYLRFLKGLWQFPQTRRVAIEDLHEKYPEKPFYVIKSRRKVRELLHSCSKVSHSV